MAFLTVRPLRDKELRNTIFHLAWPTITEQALQTIVQYVDTAQVGRINVRASAAVGLTSTTMWLVNAPIWAIAMGVLACVSQSLGAKDAVRARRAASQSVLLTLIAGISLTVLTLAISPFLPGWLGAREDIYQDTARYFAIVCAPMLFRAASIIFAAVLRAVGNTKTPMLINILMNLSNIILNFLLINPSSSWTLGGTKFFIPGAGLGVTGAAIATAFSYVAGGTLMTVYAMHSSLFSEKSQLFRYDSTAMRQCMSISVPIAADRITVMLGQVVFTSLVARLDTVSIASHTIALTAEQAFYVPGFGMQSAAATLAGYNIGSQNETKLMEYSSAITTLAVILMTSMSAVLFLFPEAIMSLFTPDQQAIALGGQVLRVVAVSEPFYAVVIILEGTFNGAGDTRVPFLMSVFTMWGVRIVSTWFCVNVFHLGLTAVWGCMVADNMTRFLLMSHRYRGRRWRHGLSKSRVENTYNVKTSKET